MQDKLLAGKLQGSFGMSEPDAGSDLWNLHTTAARDGDEWVINGSKQWTSWVADADYIFVFAVTDRDRFAARKGGISCFYVPTDTPDYKLESTIRLFQDAGGNEGITSYTDVRVPDKYCIGADGDGLAMGCLTLTTTRLWVSARAIGEGRWAFHKCQDYAKVRQTFGKTIAEHQSVQNLLADMATELYAAHSMVMNCATRADNGEDVRLETHIVKYFGTNTGTKVFDKAIQIHGGMGVTAEAKLVDGWRYARICRITEGTDQIMQRAISSHTLREGLPTWNWAPGWGSLGLGGRIQRRHPFGEASHPPDPPAGVGGPELEVAVHLGVREDQETIVAHRLPHHLGDLLWRQDAAVAEHVGRTDRVVEHARLHQLRAHHLEDHALVAMRDGHRLAEGDSGVLACRVGRVADHGQQSRGRRRDDEAARSPVDPFRNQQTGGAHVGHEVDVERLAPDLVRRLCAASAGIAGVADERADPAAQSRAGLLDDRPHAISGPQIRWHGHRSQSSRDSVELVARQIGEHDLSALTDQPFGDAETDSARAARDDDSAMSPTRHPVPPP